MRKFIKNQIIDLIETIVSGIEYAISKKDQANIAYNMLVDCYEGVGTLGERLKNNISEKDDLINSENTISYIQNSLEVLNDLISNNQDIKEVYDKLNKSFELLKDIVEKEKITFEVLFLPYKASMWDSLESIWLAAKEDKNCDAYVMPIPYFDKKTDGSLGEMHYEGYDFPKDVPVIDWKSYSLENRMPDVVYVHNPYDGYNLVTSVHPDYYSENLKKYTDMLVYVPYYTNDGCISVAQGNLPSYANFNYIITQSEKLEKFFDSKLIKDKLLPFGSPKFDRVINMCKKSSKIPGEWEERITGKKVYFFNTSIEGLLQNTGVFLNKMKYVFDTFKDREDIVLLWRPHPLFESTLKSMRPQFLEYYLKLKQYFIVGNIGILDTTPDITKTVVICDAYIGEMGSSVISLFAVAGKPIFILNSWIDKLPEKDDLKSEINYYIPSAPEFIFSSDNKLFQSDMINKDKLTYKFLCNTTNYSLKNYYVDAKKIKDRIYLCPGSAQDIGILENNVLTKIPLKHLSERIDNFSRMFCYDKYLVIVPLNYPAFVRYNMDSGVVEYFSDKITAFTNIIDGYATIGGACQRDNNIFIASPIENYVLVFDILTGKEQVFTTGASQKGSIEIFDDGVDFWFIPLKGRTIARWNPNNGKLKEYSNYPDNFRCINIMLGVEEEKNSFKTALSFGDYVVFAPWWANMFIKINKKTGEITEWKPPFEVEYFSINGYCNVFANTAFLKSSTAEEAYIITFNNNKIYRVNMLTNEFKELDIEINMELLKENTSGFSVLAAGRQYMCMENSFNSIKDFIDGTISGNKFDKDKQLEYYSEIVANIDGTCGEKVHKFIIEKVKR